MAYFPPVPPVDVKPLETKIARLETESATREQRVAVLEAKVSELEKEAPVEPTKSESV